MWKPVATAILGLWLIISPSVFDMQQQSANNNYITGPLVLTFSVISLWEINKEVIRANIVIGIWLLITLFVLSFSNNLAYFSNGTCAVFIILLSSIKRKSKQKFGGGWQSLFQEAPLHLQEAEKKYANE
ncbi:MAG TPA: hypothetical protein VFZ78_06130 [Flavisolibacter sp.]